MNQPLTLDLIDDALEAVGLRGVTRADGGRVATIGPWVDAPSFRLAVIVPDGSSVLIVRAQPGVAFPIEDLPDLLVACNTWHARNRWPRLTVVEHDQALMVQADLVVPFPVGVEAEQAAGVIATFIAATREFWTEMSEGTAPIDGILAGVADLLDRDVPAPPPNA